MSKHDIIVIKASAGGMEALKKLVAKLASNFPGTLFIANQAGTDEPRNAKPGKAR